LQLYFDFSGYSDMAIGISKMFGIRLPLNFASPYKSPNIIEFWRRWHMTLSRFLRDYLYVPLGGSRLGTVRRYINLMLTMLLGGLWHGAGWTFVAWGSLHGLFLVINHAWHEMRRRWGCPVTASRGKYAWLGVLTTFVAVVVGWVFFRANTFGGALRILAGMSGRHGFGLPESWKEDMPAPIISALKALGREFTAQAIETDAWGPVWIIALLAITWLMPNTQEVLRRYRPTLDQFFTKKTTSAVRLQWRPTIAWALAISALAILALSSGNPISEFLYFQF
jgi:alginate O-acetyltransferase complex protein AlgI